MEKYNTKFIQACKDNNINLIKNIIINTPKNEHLYLSVIYGNIDIIQLIFDTHNHLYNQIEDIFEYIYKINNLKLDNLDYIIDIYIQKFIKMSSVNSIFKMTMQKEVVPESADLSDLTPLPGSARLIAQANARISNISEAGDTKFYQASGI